MRIISGKSRGRKLTSPPGLDTRPTTDRVKESMFNLLIPYLPAKNVLDLFAGSGALGIEALSRGSEKCTFLDTDRSALLTIKKNLELARETENSEVLSIDALTFLNRTSTKFDLIFLDPPYNNGLLTKAVKLIFERGLLSDSGVIVAESEAGGEEPPSGLFEVLKHSKYGKTTVFILGLKNNITGR